VDVTDVTDPDRPPSSKEPKPLPSAAAFLGMGLSAAVCVGVGLVLGILVDDALHTAPAFLLVGLALGLAAAAMSVVKQIRSYL
jgi:F0F1-type ATP synthase assembly protein I